MVSSKDLKDGYAAMPDSELITLMAESASLTPEASVILKQEISKRGLSFQVTDLENEGFAAVDVKKEDHFSIAVLSHIYDETEKGTSKDGIEAWLSASGFDEQQVNEVTSQLPHLTAARIKDAEMQILIGSLICICGIAITFLPLSKGNSRLIYIIAWSAIITGGFKFLHGYFSKIRFKKILRNLHIFNNEF